MDVNKKTTSPTDAELDALEKQLRSWDHCWPADWLERAVIQAADAIAALRRERDEVVALAENTEARRTEVALQLNEAKRQVEALRKALRPFANMLTSYHAAARDDKLSGVNPSVGDLRRARAALAAGQHSD